MAVWPAVLGNYLARKFTGFLKGNGDCGENHFFDFVL
jgi:hypothetical protein